jgi:hypothetical protein
MTPHPVRATDSDLMGDHDEVAALRARVAELEAALAASGEVPLAAGTTAPVPAGRPRWARVLSGVLLVLACVLAPLAVVSTWASTTVSDTDRYVETVAPLADDPDVQAAVAAEVTAAILEYLDAEQVATDALEAVAAQPGVPPAAAAAIPGLVTPLVQGIESFTRDQVEALLASDRFAELWRDVNQVAHEQVVVLLEGEQGGALSAQEGTVTLNLGPVIDEVKQRMVDAGFGLAERIPSVDRSFTLVQSDDVTKAQQGYRLLNALGVWLPLVCLVLLGVGVAMAADRRRALFRAGIGLTGAMLVFGLLLLAARTWYVETTPADILTADAAGSVFDTLVRFLRTGLRSVAVLGLLLALATYATGPSASAVRGRAALERGFTGLRGSAEGHGLSTGRAGTWTWAHRGALRIGVLIAGGLVLVLWSQPSAWVVLATALMIVLALAVIELLARPPAPTP